MTEKMNSENKNQGLFPNIKFDKLIWPFVAAVAVTGYFFQPLLRYVDPLLSTFVGFFFSTTVVLTYIQMFYFHGKILICLILLSLFTFGVFTGSAALTVKDNIIYQQDICAKLYEKVTSMEGDYDKAATAYNSLSCLNPHFNSLRKQFLGGY